MEPITKSKWLVGLGGLNFFHPQGGTFTHVPLLPTPLVLEHYERYRRVLLTLTYWCYNTIVAKTSLTTFAKECTKITCLAETLLQLRLQRTLGSIDLSTAGQGSNDSHVREHG